MKDEAIRLHQTGLTKKEISVILGLGYSTIKKYTQGLITVKNNTRYVCRQCGQSKKENFYSDTTYYCKKCWNKKTYGSCLNKILTYMESRGGAICQRCGYNNCLGAIEFHHRDPKEKDPKWKKGWSILKLKKELDKCDIVCSNCHREIHAEMRSL